MQLVANDHSILVSWATNMPLNSSLVLFADLGSTTPGDLGVGSHTMKFEVAGINVAGIKPTRLTTAGLLTCTLKAKSSKGGKEPDEEVAAVNMVVQVETADGAPATKATPLESLIRSVFDPLA